jgi:hypothetical protein
MSFKKKMNLQNTSQYYPKNKHTIKIECIEISSIIQENFIFKKPNCIDFHHFFFNFWDFTFKFPTFHMDFFDRKHNW